MDLLKGDLKGLMGKAVFISSLVDRDYSPGAIQGFRTREGRLITSRFATMDPGYFRWRFHLRDSFLRGAEENYVEYARGKYEKESDRVLVGQVYIMPCKNEKSGEDLVFAGIAGSPRDSWEMISEAIRQYFLIANRTKDIKPEEAKDIAELLSSGYDLGFCLAKEFLPELIETQALKRSRQTDGREYKDARARFLDQVSGSEFYREANSICDIIEDGVNLPRAESIAFDYFMMMTYRVQGNIEAYENLARRSRKKMRTKL